MSNTQPITLLVSDDIILAALTRQALAAFERGRVLRVLDISSGKAGASLVELILAPDDYAVILAADRFSQAHGVEPEIAIAEPMG